MKIVVDTNIVFSCLLNTNSTIGEMLINDPNNFEFYSCSYMRLEIKNHLEKLKKISKLSEEQLVTAQSHVFSRLKFIDEDLIPQTIWKKALKAYRRCRY